MRRKLANVAPCELVPEQQSRFVTVKTAYRATPLVTSVPFHRMPGVKIMNNSTETKFKTHYLSFFKVR
jgi:hypothetical protein